MYWGYKLSLPSQLLLRLWILFFSLPSPLLFVLLFFFLSFVCLFSRHESGYKWIKTWNCIASLFYFIFWFLHLYCVSQVNFVASSFIRKMQLFQLVFIISSCLPSFLLPGFNSLIYQTERHTFLKFPIFLSLKYTSVMILPLIFKVKECSCFVFFLGLCSHISSIICSFSSLGFLNTIT